MRGDGLTEVSDAGGSLEKDVVAEDLGVAAGESLPGEDLEQGGFA